MRWARAANDTAFPGLPNQVVPAAPRITVACAAAQPSRGPRSLTTGVQECTNANVTHSALHTDRATDEAFVMAASKTEFLNMRVKPQTKRALRMIAERESRSMANALEWLVADYLA